MAKKANRNGEEAPKGSYIYPWDKWFSNKQTVLRRGKEFNCQPHSMSVQVRQAAARRNLSVSVLIEDDTLIIESKKKRR